MINIVLFASLLLVSLLVNSLSISENSICFCEYYPNHPTYVSYGTSPTKLPYGWQLTDQQFDQENTYLNFYLALTTNDPDQVHNELHLRSDPNSPQYGQWLTQEELFDLVRDEDAVYYISNWLNNYQITDFQEYGDNMIVNASIAQINQLFNTTVYQFVHYPSNRLHYAVWQNQLHVPYSLSDYLEMVGGLLELPKIRPSTRYTQSSDPSNPYLTAYGLRQMYNVNDY